MLIGTNDFTAEEGKKTTEINYTVIYCEPSHLLPQNL